MGALLRGGAPVKAPEFVASLIHLIGLGHLTAVAGMRRGCGIDLMLDLGPRPVRGSDAVFYEEIAPLLPRTIGEYAEAIEGRLTPVSTPEARAFAMSWRRWERAVHDELAERDLIDRGRLRSRVSSRGRALQAAWAAYALEIGRADDRGTARHLAYALVLARAGEALAAGGEGAVYELAWDVLPDDTPRLRLMALETWIAGVQQSAPFGRDFDSGPPLSDGRSLAQAHGFAARGGYRPPVFPAPPAKRRRPNR